MTHIPPGGAAPSPPSRRGSIVATSRPATVIPAAASNTAGEPDQWRTGAPRPTRTASADCGGAPFTFRGHVVRDGGPWRGVGLEDWAARFCGRDDRHAGMRPVVFGGRR